MSTFFTSAALLGLLTALWGKIRSILSRLWSLVFVTVTIQGSVNPAVKSYCWTNFKRSPFGTKCFNSHKMWVRPLNRQQEVAYESLSTDPILFWNGWRPFLLGASALERSNGTSSNEADNSRATFTFIRGTFNLDTFLCQVIERYNDLFTVHDEKSARVRRRFYIRRYVGSGQLRRGDGDTGKPSQAEVTLRADQNVDTGETRYLKWTREQLGPELTVGKSAIDALALPSELMDAIEAAKHWLASEDWFRERQIPWMLGWLIFGNPGVGKSATIRALGEDLDLPIFIFDLPSMSNQEFLRYWGEMKSNTPCMAAFEDMDAVFNGRENVCANNGGGLTFDCFLNALSGIEGANGVLKVMTTNHVEVLDEALGVPRKDSNGDTQSTRPGRADRVIELKQPNREGRLKIANRILSDCREHIERLVDEGNNDTGAQFTDRCARVALIEYWKQRDGKKCDKFTFTQSIDMDKEVQNMQRDLAAVSTTSNWNVKSVSYDNIL